MLSKQPCRQLLLHTSSNLDRLTTFSLLFTAFLDRKYACWFSFQTALNRINTRNASLAFLVLKSQHSKDCIRSCNPGSTSYECKLKISQFYRQMVECLTKSLDNNGVKNEKQKNRRKPTTDLWMKYWKATL